MAAKAGVNYAILAVIFANCFYILSASQWLTLLAVLIFSYIITSAVAGIAVNPLSPRRLVTDNFSARAKLAVFISGCDSGFGNACARRLDQLGFRVFAGCCDINNAGAKALSTETTERLQVVQCDVTDEDQVKEALKTVEQSLDGAILMSLINNAGITSNSWITLTSLEIYQRLYDVNCLGSVRLSKTFLPFMWKSAGNSIESPTIRRNCRVVFVASLAGRYFLPYLSAYSISKAGVLALADTLRRESKTFGVSVHTIEPSTYKTDFVNVELFSRNWNKNWLDYGEKSLFDKSFFERSKRHFLTILEKSTLPVSKIDEVVDDMVDAAVGLTPQMSYVPNLMTRIRLWVYLHVPTRVLDWLVIKRLIPKR